MLCCIWVLFFFLRKFFSLSIRVSVWVCAPECRCPWRPEDWIPLNWSGCELLRMGAGNGSDPLEEQQVLLTTAYVFKHWALLYFPFRTEPGRLETSLLTACFLLHCITMCFQKFDFSLVKDLSRHALKWGAVQFWFLGHISTMWLDMAVGLVLAV